MGNAPGLAGMIRRGGGRGIGAIAAGAFAAGVGLLGNVWLALDASAQSAPPCNSCGTPMRPVGFADIVDKVKPAVFSVRVKIDAGSLAAGDSPDDAPLERFLRRFGAPNGGQPRRGRVVTGQGSGFFISPDGYAVTNGHVVDKAKTVEITTDDGATYAAKVIGSDARSDVALIKIEGRTDFPVVTFSEGHPRVGDWVLAVGNPFGLGGTVTAGIVSARSRDIGAGPYDDFIQIDAPVNKGNSGGPTFDVEGNVIGVNTAIVSPSGGSVGIAFAIPAEAVKGIVAQLRDKGVVTRGWIGVQIGEVTPDIAGALDLKSQRGAVVVAPQPGGPAVKAGIEAGDVIVAIGSKEIGDSKEVARTISAMAPGASVPLKIIRKGREQVVNVTLGELPEQRDAALTPETPGRRGGVNVPQLGFAVATRSHGEGVAVLAIDPSGPAAGQGIKNGDIILEIAGKKVASSNDIRNAVQSAQKGGKRSVVVLVKSGDETKAFTVPVSRG